jgi:hypothetical protein
MEKDRNQTDKRTDERISGNSIPAELRRAVITIDGGDSFPVRVVNVNGCGFMFESDDTDLPTAINLEEGTQITARFMGTGTSIKGICVHSSSRGRSTSLGCFISDPYEQNLVRDVLKRG